jgi:hypothetical protein
VALDTSGIVLSLPIVNVKGTDLALFNPRGKTELNSSCARLLAAKFPNEATVILTAAGKAEGLLQATSEAAGIPAVAAVKEIKPYMTSMVADCSADEKRDLFHDSAARAYRIPTPDLSRPSETMPGRGFRRRLPALCRVPGCLLSCGGLGSELADCDGGCIPSGLVCGS